MKLYLKSIIIGLGGVSPGLSGSVLMILFGSPCAVSSYTMAAQMDGDAELAAQQVMLTTLLSSVTMFLMIFTFKSLGVF